MTCTSSLEAGIYMYFINLNLLKCDAIFQKGVYANKYNYKNNFLKLQAPNNIALLFTETYHILLRYQYKINYSTLRVKE